MLNVNLCINCEMSASDGNFKFAYLLAFIFTARTVFPATWVRMHKLKNDFISVRKKVNAMSGKSPILDLNELKVCPIRFCDEYIILWSTHPVSYPMLTLPRKRPVYWDMGKYCCGMPQSLYLDNVLIKRGWFQDTSKPIYMYARHKVLLETLLQVCDLFSFLSPTVLLCSQC